MFVFPTPIIGRGKAEIIPIIDDFEGTWSPDATNGTPPNWSASGGSAGGTTRYTVRPFSGTYSFRCCATFDGDSSYYGRTWTRSALALAGHNRLKIRRASGSGGSAGFNGNETFKLNGSDASSYRISSFDTGVSGPDLGASSTWREHILDISSFGSSLTISIVSASTSPSAWPYFDKFELYGE